LVKNQETLPNFYNPKPTSQPPLTIVSPSATHITIIAFAATHQKPPRETQDPMPDQMADRMQI